MTQDSLGLWPMRKVFGWLEIAVVAIRAWRTGRRPVSRCGVSVPSAIRLVSLLPTLLLTSRALASRQRLNLISCTSPASAEHLSIHHRSSRAFAKVASMAGQKCMTGPETDRGLIALMQNKRHGEGVDARCPRCSPTKLARLSWTSTSPSPATSRMRNRGLALEKLPDDVVIDNWVQMQSGAVADLRPEQEAAACAPCVCFTATRFDRAGHRDTRRWARWMASTYRSRGQRLVTRPAGARSKAIRKAHGSLSIRTS